MKKAKITLSISILSIFIFVFSIIGTPYVEAESTVWSKTFPDSYYAKIGPEYITALISPSVQVRYKYQMRNDDTGGLISCGDSVPTGTSVTYEFLPHHYTDVYWFGTGRAYDSPYGSWVRNAGRSSGGICVTKNYYFTETGNGFVNATKHYSDFAVNPPAKRVEDLPADNCTAGLGGNTTCLFDEPGVINSKFVFESTYGKWHYGYTRKILSRGICTVIEDPLNDIPTTNAWIIRFFTGSPGSSVNGRTYIRKNSSEDPVSIFSTLIPEQKINCQVNVKDPTGTAPEKPVITGDSYCKVGIPAEYTFVAADPDTDPEESQIRYAIDWDADGSVDQLVPGSGYLPSHTPQTVSHVWRTPGPKTIRAFTEDKQGLVSDWATYTIDNCLENEDFDLNANLLDGDAYGDLPDGAIDFSFDRDLTNSTCHASWSVQYASDCGIYRNNELVQAVAESGEADLVPGSYSLRCTQLNNGGIIAVEQRCLMNPNVREI